MRRLIEQFGRGSFLDQIVYLRHFLCLRRHWLEAVEVVGYFHVDLVDGAWLRLVLLEVMVLFLEFFELGLVWGGGSKV